MKSILKSLIALAFISSTASAQTPKTRQIKNESTFVKLEQKGFKKIPFNKKCRCGACRYHGFTDAYTLVNAEIGLYLRLWDKEDYISLRKRPSIDVVFVCEPIYKDFKYLKYNLDYIRNNMQGIMSYRTDALNFFWKQF